MQFRVRSFVSERFDRVQSRGPDGWIDAEEEADGDGNDKSNNRDVAGDSRRPFGADQEPAVDSGGKCDTHDYADYAAAEGEKYGFGNELSDDVAAFGTHSLSDTDLTCAFSDGDEHDIHDPDATDEK